jgi:hypothetical protein
MNAQARRMIEGARLFALADRSDPFAFNRAMSHTLNGVASAHDGDKYYQAEPSLEQRVTPKGERYNVTVYKEVKRP